MLKIFKCCKNIRAAMTLPLTEEVARAQDHRHPLTIIDLVTEIHHAEMAHPTNHLTPSVRKMVTVMESLHRKVPKIEILPRVIAGAGDHIPRDRSQAVPSQSSQRMIGDNRHHTYPRDHCLRQVLKAHLHESTHSHGWIHL